MSAVPRFGCVVLTQGRRPADLRRAVASLLAQEGVAVDVVVVGNGWAPEGLPEGVRGLFLREDLGAAAGRNAGVPAVGGELLFFLDDDASLADAGVLARVAARLAAEPRIGLLQLRVAPRTEGPAAREWVPRLRAGDPARSGDVTHVWEGAVAMPRAVFDRVGGWPADFRIIHEGIDLGWRVMDAGLRVHYAGDILALHPPYVPARNDYQYYFAARNRVWLARRYLPLPLGVLYVATFVLRAAPRLRSPARLRRAARGYRDGLREPAGPRRPLHARTLLRMTLMGRPPVI